MSKYNADTDIPEREREMASCISKRENAYLTELGSWQQQLDMIFHDFDGWKIKIANIKSRFPKP